MERSIIFYSFILGNHGLLDGSEYKNIIYEYNNNITVLEGAVVCSETKTTSANAKNVLPF